MPTIANLSDPITDAGKPVTNATARLTPRISGVASAQTAIRGSPELRAPTAIVLDILRELGLVEFDRVADAPVEHLYDPVVATGVIPGLRKLELGPASPPRSGSLVQRPRRVGRHEDDVPLSVHTLPGPGTGRRLLRVEARDPHAALCLLWADGEPVEFADLQELWRDPKGVELSSATIITTEAGPDTPIHNRQPVVLEQEAWDHWPDPDVTNREELESSPPPTEEGTLVDHPADRAVGTVRNDGPELVEAVAPSGDW
jgi:hypothetical protein